MPSIAPCGVTDCDMCSGLHIHPANACDMNQLQVTKNFSEDDVWNCTDSFCSYDLFDYIIVDKMIKI